MTSQSWLQPIIRYGYFPLMAFGLNGLAITAIFSGMRPTTLAVTIFGLMAVALFLSFGSERLLPYNRAWNRPQGDSWRDVAHFLVNESMSLVPLLILPIFVIATPIQATSIWPTEWPIILQLLLCLLFFDLMQNLFHWFAHVWPPLWRLHAVHHEVTRMYGFNGILKHPIYQLLSGIVSTAPLSLMGMPKAFSLALVFMVFTQLLLQHANTAYSLGWFRRIFAVAEVHRFHHLRGKAGDVNFSLFFSFYDHLFGNAFYEHRSLETGDIGLNYCDYPKSWWGQMKAPFQHFYSREGSDSQVISR